MSRGPAWHRAWLTLSTATVHLAGCGEGNGQSSLNPAGPAAASIAWLWWLMCVAFTAVFLLVVVLLLLAIYRRSLQRLQPSVVGTEGPMPPLGRNAFVIAGGIVMPVVVLVPILFVSLNSSAKLKMPNDDAQTVGVVGHMWWWEISYRNEGIVTANEIHIPVGEPVRLELDSADVIHSFWVPSLNGKRDLIPGKTNSFWIQADKPGIYRGQCAEYCGVQHANMIILIVALPRDEYRAWLDGKRAALTRTTPPAHERGRHAFRTAGCAVCHTVRGTGAEGKAGPDLTHFGSRQAVAGVLANTRGNVAGWIGDPQSIKPGARMPRSYLRPDDLLAITDYLESLE